MELWIVQVDGPQQAAFKKDVVQPFETGLAGLRGRYVAALERAIADKRRTFDGLHGMDCRVWATFDCWHGMDCR